jgi:hypothetical protein
LRHISLPGLTLAAGVVIAAVLALLVMKGSEGGDPGYRMPLDHDGGIVRLGPGDDASRAQYVAGAAGDDDVAGAAGNDASRAQYVTGAATGAVLGDVVRRRATRSGSTP